MSDLSGQRTERHDERALQLDRRLVLKGFAGLTAALALSPATAAAEPLGGQHAAKPRLPRFQDRATVDPAKWQVAMEDSFEVLAREGHFLASAYGNRWGAYPTSYTTTSGRGYYDPGRISVIDTPGGERVMQCRLLPSAAGGRPSGCAPQPKIHGSAAWGTSVVKGEMRVRVERLGQGWKSANLGWPVPHEGATTDDASWPKHGELDVFETSFDAAAKVTGYLHVENGDANGSDKVHLTSKQPITEWFTVGWERQPGKYFAWFVNGEEIRRVTDTQLRPGHGIPNKPMRWVLQLEDDCGNPNPPTAEARVWYDWFTLWVPA